MKFDLGFEIKANILLTQIAGLLAILTLGEADDASDAGSVYFGLSAGSKLASGMTS